MYVSTDGRRQRELTMDADQKSSMVVPSATVVPLTSMIQNNADKSGRERISQRKRTLRWPGRALVVGHVTTGASSDNQYSNNLTITSIPVGADHYRIYMLLHTDSRNILTFCERLWNGTYRQKSSHRRFQLETDVNLDISASMQIFVLKLQFCCQEAPTQI